MKAVRLASAIAVVGATLACRSTRPTTQSTPDALPEIPVYVIAPTDSAGLAVRPAPRGRDPLADLGADKLVSLTSSNADARTLLLWLAQQAGVSLVVAPDVNARVSVSFTNVRASDAMRAVLAEADLSILAPDEGSPWPPVVFFQRPVNVNDVSADEIVARFGVSRDMARWIVESRPRP